MKRRYEHINAQCIAMRHKMAGRIVAKFPELWLAAEIGMRPSYFAKVRRATKAPTIEAG